MKPDESRIVKEGVRFYDVTVPCRIVITCEDLFPGSGDYEDPPDIREDRQIPCVQIWFENPAQKDNFNASGGYALAIEEAMTGLEDKMNRKIQWKT